MDVFSKGEDVTENVGGLSYHKKPELLKDQIRDAIQKGLKHFEGQKNTPVVRRRLEFSCSQLLSGFLDLKEDKYHVDFEVVEGSDPRSLHIKPNNLFTLMLMNGFYVPCPFCVKRPGTTGVFLGRTKRQSLGRCSTARNKRKI